MKVTMKKSLITIACLASFVSVSAYASCGFSGDPNEVCPPAVVPPAPVVPVDPAPIPSGNVAASAVAAATASSTASAEQRQQQQQAQAQRQQANGNGAGAGAYSGSNSVVIQGAQAGSGDRTLVLSLPSVPATPPSFVASAHMAMMWSPCGPLVRVVAEAVYGEYRGLFGGVTQVYLGANEKTADYLDHLGNVQPYAVINGRWFGHQVLYSGAVPGVASGTNLTIGGAGGAGGGQAGGGTSGGMQRPVERVQYRLCDLTPEAKPVVIRQQVFVEPMKPIVRKPVRKAEPCVLEAKTVKVCKTTNTTKVLP